MGTAVAITDVTLLITDVATFNDLCRKYPELQLTVQESCLMETRLLLKRVEMVTFRSVRERVATVLLDEIRKLEATGAPSKEICLTHFDVARF
jgi:CRP-like cAMP-binding protein